MHHWDLAGGAGGCQSLSDLPGKFQYRASPSDRWGGVVAIVYHTTIALTRKLVQQLPVLNVFIWCWMTMLGWGLLLVYHPLLPAGAG